MELDTGNGDMLPRTLREEQQSFLTLCPVADRHRREDMLLDHMIFDDAPPSGEACMVNYA